jgi:putative CocE/NonD family hydrolase
MRRFSFLILLCASALVARADAAYTRTDAMVKMSDGVRLEASVYVPVGNAPPEGYPLIVRQHGGGSDKDNSYDTIYGINFVETGNFALLMYSHRGHGNSGGFFDFFGERTTLDFSEMLDWVESSFGPQIDTERVGASGISQGGGESLLPAANDPRVKAVAVGNTFADLNQALNPNDCMKLSFDTAIFVAAYKASAARTEDALAVRWGSTLYTDTEDVAVPGFVSTTEDLHARSPLTYVQSLVDRRVPVYWTQSWEDYLFPGDHPAQFLAPLEVAGVPVHYWFSSGGHAAGPNDPTDEAAKELDWIDWMDEFLRGVDHGFASGARPRVDYAERLTQGLPGEWTHRTAAAWPIPAATPLVLYPRGDGTLAGSPGEPGPVGTIVNDFATANVANDPIATNEVPGRVPAPGVRDAVRTVPEGANPLDTAPFLSDPLSTPLHVVGAPAVDALLSTTASRVVQLNAKVWDVAPDGSRVLVNRGCLSFENAGPKPVAAFDLWPNAHTFPAGHRIELTLAAVDFPVFKPDTEPALTDILAGTSLSLPVLTG